MSTALPTAIAKAMRLTRAGDMAGAAETIQSMMTGAGVSGSAPAARPSPSSARPAGAGAFSRKAYAGPAGSMDYWLYAPADAVAGMPLVVMLHGCTQSPEDFARGTGMNALADELGFLVAYPGQSSSANAQKCWNWFKPGDQQRDRGEPALIAGITRAVIAEQRADPARVYVAGLSAGGAAAAIMAAAYPDIFAAVGVHSGLGCGVARDLTGALTAMKRGGTAPAAGQSLPFVPVITFHGDRDATVDEINSRQIVAAAAAARGSALSTHVETSDGPGARGFTRRFSVDGHGRALIEQWTIHGAGHAWSGGDGSGSYTDPSGPDASRAMLRFFLEQRRPGADMGA